jgi:hypothetical protein
MLILLRLLTVHFMADFVFQTDWMALNKSKRFDALFVHTSAYGLSFILWGWRFALLTFVLHTMQDAITSRMTAALWQRGARHWFFVIIGLDQLLHAYALAFAWWVLLR